MKTKKKISKHKIVMDNNSLCETWLMSNIRLAVLILYKLKTNKVQVM